MIANFDKDGALIGPKIKTSTEIEKEEINELNEQNKIRKNRNYNKINLNEFQKNKYEEAKQINFDKQIWCTDKTDSLNIGLKIIENLINLKKTDMFTIICSENKIEDWTESLINLGFPKNEILIKPRKGRLDKGLESYSDDEKYHYLDKNDWAKKQIIIDSYDGTRRIIVDEIRDHKFEVIVTKKKNTAIFNLFSRDVLIFDDFSKINTPLGKIMLDISKSFNSKIIKLYHIC